MNIYLDFEATQPKQEIISIGAVAENGSTFYSLVKPQLSSIDKFISNMIHISPEELEQAKTIDQVLIDFDMWVYELEPDIMKCRFISYGNDSQFVKSTIPAITDEHAFITAAVLLLKIEDSTKDTFKFFHGSISLINAFNYIQEEANKQKHDSLEDAIMLKKVYEYMLNNEPLREHPFRSKNENHMPSGTFWCKKNKKERINFNSCEEAVNWLIENEIGYKENKEVIHKNRMDNRIMMSIRKNEPYFGYRWGRVKGGK